MKKAKKELSEVIYGLLKNSKMEILHVAYRYNKKPYANQDWLRKNLFQDWGIEIDSSKKYITTRDIQNELLNVDFDKLLPYMEFIYKSVKRVTGDYFFTQNKYRQLKLAHFRFENYYNELKSSNKFHLISWIESIDKELYIDITNDNNWENNFIIHIGKVHTAFHSFLLKCANKCRYIPSYKESITSLYKNIYSHLPEKEQYLLKTDGYLVKVLNELRNNSSKVHPNASPNIRQDIGLSFLLKVKNLVKEIKTIF